MSELLTEAEVADYYRIPASTLNVATRVVASRAPRSTGWGARFAMNVPTLRRG
jgi:hypothetical protein